MSFGTWVGGGSDILLLLHHIFEGAQFSGHIRILGATVRKCRMTYDIYYIART